MRTRILVGVRVTKISLDVISCATSANQSHVQVLYFPIYEIVLLILVVVKVLSK